MGMETTILRMFRVYNLRLGGSLADKHDGSCWGEKQSVSQQVKP